MVVGATKVRMQECERTYGLCVDVRCRHAGVLLMDSKLKQDASTLMDTGLECSISNHTCF